MLTEVYISLGSNVGQPITHIETALLELAMLPDTTLLRYSQLHQTKPVGGVEQPDFTNAMACLATRLSPRDLLHVLHVIEQRHGRDRTRAIRYGPRPLDLDIILYGDQKIDETDLKIPHPEFRNRAFVLDPLSEILPKHQHSILFAASPPREVSL